MNKPPPSGHDPTPPAASAPAPFLVALTGNPNCGKTTLFNLLTGLRAKVGNYAGVTVERKEGRMRSTQPGLDITILDLPGTYSLSAKSIDEQIARDVLFNRLPELPPPDLVVVVIDASNLERNLYYASQVIELGHRVVIALNMIDVARNNGHHIDVAALKRELAVPVIPIVASTGEGISDLRARLQATARAREAPPVPAPWCRLPRPLATETSALASRLLELPRPRPVHPHAEALLLLSDEHALPSDARSTATLRPLIEQARARLEQAGIDWRSAVIEARYARAAAIHERTVTETMADRETFSDRLDRIVTHRTWGTLLFLAIMGLMFQSIFTFAQWPMDLIDATFAWLGDTARRLLPSGDLQSLIADGILAGVGAVVIFLPQILLLFLFLGILEDTGYMARAAFLMDRLMSKVGLHGKSFIPLLSSFACAIPGIMATRTIESPKDRLATMLVAPLMSCSARLPVYTVLIAAAIPQTHILGFLHLRGLTLLGMYLLGVLAALAIAWLLKKSILKGDPPLLLLELPPYRRPALRTVLRHMWERSQLFLRQAGTVILAASIILWFLASYPNPVSTRRHFDQLRAQVNQTAAHHPTNNPAIAASLETQIAQINNQEAGERLRNSFAGRLGRTLEPLIEPLGFDWKIGIGIVASFAAREVFVSTMSTVYNVGDIPDDPDRAMAETFRAQRHSDGTAVYTLPTALALMVFYVFALQCISTVAIMRRETNTWKWPVLQWIAMAILAWLAAFATQHLARWLT